MRGWTGRKWEIAGFIALALLFVGLKWALLAPADPRVFPDTASYLQVAQAGLASSEFWAGPRPLTLPLMCKLLGIREAGLDNVAALTRVKVAQGALSSAAWLCLALAFSQLIVQQWARLLSFTLVLAFGLNIHVSQWDLALLSESLSTSLFALVLALAAFGLAYEAILARKRALRAGYFGALALLLLLFSFTRDSNLVLVSLGAVGILGFGLIGYARDSRWSPWLIAVGMFVIASAGLQVRSIERGERWQIPFYNIVHARVLPSEKAREHFIERGLPAGERLQVLSALDRSGFIDSLQNNRRYKEIVQWLEAEGRAAYISYLLKDPYSLAVTPLHHRHQLINPDSTEFLPEGAPTPGWLRVLSSVVYPRSIAVLMLAVGFCTAVTLWRMLSGPIASWLLPAALVLLCYPMMLAVWYGDAVEVERHAYQLAMQLRLGLLLWGLLLLGGERASREASIA